MIPSKKQINDNLVKKINTLLTEIGSDYKELAKAMDYSDNSYAFRLLKGEKIINIETLVRITAALKNINAKKDGKVDNSCFLLSNIFENIHL